jgi:hypothetical protein
MKAALKDTKTHGLSEGTQIKYDIYDINSIWLIVVNHFLLV